MKWAVVNKYYNNGKVEAEIFETWGEWEKMIDFKYKNAGVCDTYVDEFNSLDEAVEFQKQCYNA